jgi:hypothetical protein
VNEIEDDPVYPDIPIHQQIFDEIMGNYNPGVEPLEFWTSEHLIQLGRALDAELQLRYDENEELLPDTFRGIVDDFS